MSKIHTITDLHFLRATWSDVFVSNDSFGWPFVDRIKSGMLFFPTEGYHLAESQYEAIVAAAKSVGEDGFILSITEGGGIVERGEHPWSQHWSCELPKYDEYLHLPLNLENSLYSRNATWGIMMSHEDHAIVGGEDAFISTLRSMYPHWQEDIRKLIETWANNPNGSWVANLVYKCPWLK